MEGPWNLGVKVKDLDADLAFLEACGATQIQKGTIPLPEGDAPFGMAFLGTQRLLLFPHVIYEDTLAEPLKNGLTHVVYEVDDCRRSAATLQTARRDADVGPGGSFDPFRPPSDCLLPFAIGFNLRNLSESCLADACHRCIVLLEDRLISNSLRLDHGNEHFRRVGP